MKHFLRIAAILLALCLAPLALLISCQSKLIYYPRPYPPGTVTDWEQGSQRKSLAFTTSQGKQRAYLQGNLKTPRNLWIVCGGNGTVALDWSECLTHNAPEQDAFLLVDFPGYGDCEGAPNPARIAETFRTIVPIATAELGLPTPPDPARLRIFGHSLGAAAVMIASAEFGIQRGVLLAPFTSTMEMGEIMTGFPVGFLVTHRYDNLARLAELSHRGPGKVLILHGTNDRIIPADMSRRLAAAQPAATDLILLNGAGHNTAAQSHATQLAAALTKAGE